MQRVHSGPASSTTRAWLMLITIQLLILVGVMVADQVLQEAHSPPSVWILLSFLPVATVVIIATALDLRRQPYSLTAIHLFTVGLLLVFIPMLQFVRGKFPHGPYFRVDDQAVVRANVILLVWVLMFVFGGMLAVRLRDRQPLVRLLAPLLGRPISQTSLRVGAAVASLAVVYLAVRGVGGAFTRKAFVEDLGASSTIELLFGNVFARAMPIVSLAGVSLFLLMRPKKRTLPNLVLLAGLLAAVFWFTNPLAAARYWTSTVGIAFISMLILRRLKTGIALITGLTFGLLLLPVMNVGRQTREVAAFAEAEIEDEVPSYLASAKDFDAYQNLAMVDHYVRRRGSTLGRQLLGVVFFWVPRSVWSTKPIGTGTMVSGYYGYPNKNVATPLPAEAIINFGYLGVPIFALFFGFLARSFDLFYHRQQQQSAPSQLRVFDVVYLFWLGLVVFVTRGDMLSGIAYTLGVTMAGVLVLAPLRFAK